MRGPVSVVLSGYVHPIILSAVARIVAVVIVVAQRRPCRGLLMNASRILMTAPPVSLLLRGTCSLALPVVVVVPSLLILLVVLVVLIVCCCSRSCSCSCFLGLLEGCSPVCYVDLAAASTDCYVDLDTSTATSTRTKLPWL